MADYNLDIRNNLKSFRETFRDFSDSYAVIGGAACFILLENAGLSFRATSDIDMILILEDRGEAFGKIFWNYIIEGGYTCGIKPEEPHYFRFTNPKSGYPEQIELFSRRSSFLDSRIIPVYISEDVSSLSAIALDEDYYKFMINGRTVIDDVCVLGADHIIPFKMFAYLNNLERRQKGEHVNSDDIKKHKNDVFRLLPLVNPAFPVETLGNVRKNVETFLSMMEQEPIDRSFLLEGRGKVECLDLLRTIYLTK